MIKKVQKGVSKLVKSSKFKKTDEQEKLRKDIYKYFDSFDVNQNGYLTEVELRQLLISLSKHPETGNHIDFNSETKQLMKRIDTNHDGIFTREEFFQFYISS